MPQRDGASCPGCGLPNYEGLCPVCRGDESGYCDELEPFFGPWRGEHEAEGRAVEAHQEAKHGDW